MSQQLGTVACDEDALHIGDRVCVKRCPEVGKITFMRGGWASILFDGDAVALGDFDVDDLVRVP